MADRNDGGQFVRGHGKVGTYSTPKGVRHSPSTEFKKGLMPWNKGELVMLICKECGKPFEVHPYNVGRSKFCSKECTYKGRDLKGLFVSGHAPANGGHTGHNHSEETRRKISEKGLIRFQDPAQIRKISESHKGKKLTKEHIRKCLSRRPMSSLEVSFDNIVKELGLPYKFVGNGAFFIERKNPDFININGDKIAVEVYNRKHKNLFKCGLEAWRKERSALFAEYGWSVLYFDETQINKEAVLSKMGAKN